MTPAEGEEAPAASLAEKPLLVWVYDPAAEDNQKIETVILGDDKIAVGAKAFQCMKISPEAAENDPLIADEGREVPRFLLITPDYEDVTVLEGGRLSVSGTYKAMKTVARRVYETNFDKNVRTLVKLLNEFDQINSERTLLDQKAERNDNPSASEERRLARDREELAEREKEANEKRDELLTFVLKEKYLRNEA